ncbi:MAG: nitroreductase family protein [Anaerolineae bacterium]
MDLYQAIVNRRSVRRYEDKPLERQNLKMVDDIIDHTQPLVPENRFRVMRRDVVTGEDLIAAMGGYGRILTPPHYMVASAVGDLAPLVDLGYRLEQIAVQIVQIGLSVCFIGSLGRESNVRVRFRLNDRARTGAFLIFGHAAQAKPDKAIDALIGKAAGGESKLAANDIFYVDSFDRPRTPPRSLTRIVEAARRAPSANNVQPWRFLWKDEVLYLFLQRENPRYGNKAELQEYRYVDGGACMANVKMAAETLGVDEDWGLIRTSTVGVPEHPETLEPLAKLKLG